MYDKRNHKVPLPASKASRAYGAPPTRPLEVLINEVPSKWPVQPASLQDDCPSVRPMEESDLVDAAAFAHMEGIAPFTSMLGEALIN